MLSFKTEGPVPSQAWEVLAKERKETVIFGVSASQVDGILRLNKKALSNLIYKAIDEPTLVWTKKTPCPLPDPALTSQGCRKVPFVSGLRLLKTLLRQHSL